jgi:hypothetical protein
MGNMSGRLLERYSSAVNSSDLSVNPNSKWSDTDVLGAAGLAGRYEPLGVALTRLFADGKPEAALLILSDMAFKRARTLRVKVTQVQADDLSKAVLGWYRHGSCQPCGGTGFQTIPGTPIQGDECPRCRGVGRIPFEPMFPEDTRELARWLSGEIDRAQVAAGRTAMALLAPTLDL